jgi:hypothetical protein
VEARGAYAIVGRRSSGEDLSTADDGSTLGVPVKLANHCVRVRGYAKRFANSLGLPQAVVSDIALAGVLHDVGNADPRFQVWLHGGDEVAAALANTPLAKSAQNPRNRAAIRQQNFLSSVEKLMIHCSPKHLHQALFEAWNPQDEKYSLRLDSADDRRYALMDRNPTAEGNEPLTLWGANRLTFEALRFFPAMPLRGGMGVRGWRAANATWRETCQVRWPLWQQPITAAAITSLLGLDDLWLGDPTARERLIALGVHVVMESRRIEVAKKRSPTPATPVWISNSRQKAAV